MPVILGELGPIKVNCLIWTGAVTRSEALGVPARIDPSRPEFGPRWMSYFNAGVDLSDLDPATFLEFRDRFRPVVSALAAKGEYRSIIVSNSRYNDPLLAVWRTLVATDDSYAANPEHVPTFQAAAHALALSQADANELERWIEAQLARMSANPP